MERFMVRLASEEMQALCTLAIEERRDFRDQAAFLIRRVLRQTGFLATSSKLSPEEKLRAGVWPSAERNVPIVTPGDLPE